MAIWTASADLQRTFRARIRFTQLGRAGPDKGTDAPILPSRGRSRHGRHTAKDPDAAAPPGRPCDSKKLFVKLGAVAARAGVAAANGTWATAAGAIITDLSGAAEAVSRDTPPEALAWRLLRRFLTRALAEMVAESLADQRPPTPGDE